MLRVGIVGLPNAGKSTLFNALTRSHQAHVASYPFCTIEPNVGVIEVPDPRLDALARIYKTETKIPTTIEFFDIAGLVRGASRGEGLGNQFLAHIRQVDAIVEVIRCFEEEDIAHVEGSLNPIRDIETIRTELALADLGAVDRRKEKTVRQAKVGDKAAVAELVVLEKLEAALNSGRSVRTLQLPEAERAIVDELFLLTVKPAIRAVNVSEADLGRLNPFAQRVRDFAAQEGGGEVVEVCAELEAQLADLSPDEAASYLAELGATSSGVDRLIRSAYRLLGLITFFTGNEKEVRARAIPAGTKMPQAAGHVHSDIERGFIAAEVISYADLISAGSFAKAREHGSIRMEGKSHVVNDGDVVLFRFHV
jgi:ribosome-binding ATPase